MRILCVFGQHNYGDPARGEGYEYTNFIPAFRRLGHEVLFFESWNRDCARDFVDLNSNLLRTVEQHRPDVVFSVMFTYEIWLETWELLRDAGIATTVNWTTDDSWKYACSSRFLAPAFHAFTTTYSSALANYKKDEIQNVILTQWAANASALQTPLPAVQCKYQVSFVGTAYGARPRWIGDLRSRGIHVDCFGYGWPAGPLMGSEIADIIRNSVISLNFAKGESFPKAMRLHRIPQIKARTFEVPGAGGFLLTERVDGLEEWYAPGKEIETFESLRELEEKIRHYLKHTEERDSIAERGHERTRAEHTYDQRLSEVLAFAVEQREAYFRVRDEYPAGCIDWNRFEDAARSHTLGWTLRFLKKFLVGCCSLVIGTRRGARAARRLVFEASWRLAGISTYSSVGLPGRMFYR